jgi:transcriptional regulator with XRE-family HTH domain
VAKRDRRAAQQSHAAAQALRVVFGKNCKTHRMRMGLTQQDVARATGITQPRIAQIELGNINITLETAARIAHAVDSDVLHLLRSTGIKRRK